MAATVVGRLIQLSYLVPHTSHTYTYENVIAKKAKTGSIKRITATAMCLAFASRHFYFIIIMYYKFLL